MSKKVKKPQSYVRKVDFKSMDATQRRIAIAKDVIAGLKTQRLVATEGVYCQLDTPIKVDLPESDTVELSDVLKKNMGNGECEVCAKGAMFIAAVEKFNQLKVKVKDITYNGTLSLGEISDNSFVSSHLEKYFPRKQLDLIEAAFEGEEFNGDADDEELKIINLYSEIYPEAEDRMIAIMESIIRNNGKFICKLP